VTGENGGADEERRPVNRNSTGSRSRRLIRNGFRAFRGLKGDEEVGRDGHINAKGNQLIFGEVKLPQPLAVLHRINLAMEAMTFRISRRVNQLTLANHQTHSLNVQFKILFFEL
jgi:hypothetical protein